MSQKVCAIVGVGKGLGLAIAQRFGQEGYAIAMLARRAEALTTYQAELEQQGIAAQGFSVDVADSTALSQAFEQIAQTMGAPEVLVYNAAVMKESDPLTIPNDEFVTEFKVTVAGALTSIQQVAPAMKSQGRGTILLTGGALAYDEYSFPPYVSLAVGKAGIRKLCFVMANALAPDNIHVATVTVCGTIQPETHFAPDKIAEVYWQLHTQPKADWKTEYVYR
ncbi:SDR family NAD(P)-dependent oxidoreductase [Leptolyngbya sp. NIES-2104]|uniref:SDR family NAD(P)-dependent oxidoreductase n=1 Tax=Leptolyngbya sp. NIES-2104 TaxID=1552121 RepID=UPI0006EC811D|nr:SDR family NAD(P)-dependent oxidoreductase [Leptolyngbya sp. NIES-2104]GAP97998.1 short-chain dehydrogenase/reductase SDR [Leptolyngbya sp. NIES-2104]